MIIFRVLEIPQNRSFCKHRKNVFLIIKKIIYIYRTMHNIHHPSCFYMKITIIFFILFYTRKHEFSLFYCNSKDDMRVILRFFNLKL